MAFNDRLALGAIQAIHQAGLKVPDDISVIGYDNSDQAKYSMPKITTVEIHASLMAQTAARMLFQPRFPLPDQSAVRSHHIAVRGCGVHKQPPHGPV
nr:substrate-binding domain-containing protein [Clostridium sp. 1001271st1 H5]